MWGGGGGASADSAIFVVPCTSHAGPTVKEGEVGGRGTRRRRTHRLAPRGIAVRKSGTAHVWSASPR